MTRDFVFNGVQYKQYITKVTSVLIVQGLQPFYCARVALCRPSDRYPTI